MLTEEERADHADRLTAKLVATIVAHLPADTGEDDVVGVGVLACVTLSVALAASKCVTAAAAVGLIHCIAEAVAQEIYGDSNAGADDEART